MTQVLEIDGRYYLPGREVVFRSPEAVREITSALWAKNSVGLGMVICMLGSLPLYSVMLSWTTFIIMIIVWTTGAYVAKRLNSHVESVYKKHNLRHAEAYPSGYEHLKTDPLLLPRQ